MSGREGLLDLFARWDRQEGPLSGAAIRRQFGRLRLVRVDLADGIAFSDVSYQRVLIHSGPSYEALVLCWRSGQSSPIHDHGGSTCGVYIIEGTATETVFAASPCGRLAPVRSHTFGAGAFRVSGDRDIHQMANLESPGSDLISLHIYSPPLTGMRTYSIGETTLADHDRLIAARPPLLKARIRADGPHSFPQPHDSSTRQVTS
jgi:cysteine dioxygenase